MGQNLIIIMEAYGFINGDGFSWENSGLGIVEILGGQQLHFCDDEIRVLCESLAEISPLKNERRHKLTLERIYERGGYNNPSICFYREINKELMPHQCSNCGSFLEKEDSEKYDLLSVGHEAEPFCGVSCAEFYNR